MPRRDDPRPPIEVLGAGPPEEPPQRVTIGDGGGRRRRLFVGVLVVVALVVAGLLLTEGEDEPDNAEQQSTTSTTRVRGPRPSTTTTAFAPTGPVLPVQTGGLAVVISEQRTHVIDLDTGARERAAGTLEPYEVVPVRDGVAGMRDGRLVYLPVRGPDREPRDLGRADRVLQAGRDDAVWTVAYPQLPSGAGYTTAEARLVTMGGEVERSFEIGDEPLWGTAAGLITYDGGRIYLTDDRGSRALAVGEVHGAAGNELVVRECDERRQCGFVRLDVATGRRVALEVPTAGRFGQSAISLAPTGEMALSTYALPPGPQLQLLDAGGQLIGSGPLDVVHPAAVLSGLGLLASRSDGPFVRVAPDGVGGLVVQELPAFEGLQRGATIVVVP